MEKKVKLLTAMVVGAGMIPPFARGGPRDNWAERFPASVPSPRDHAFMWYDEDAGGVVLFGGHYRTGQGEDVWYIDTWRWDGHTWDSLDIDASCEPLRRSGAAKCYDPDRQALIVFGGLYQGTKQNDVWEMRWDSLASSYACAEIQHTTDGAPEPREWARMAYDTLTGTCVLFDGRNAAGQDLNETWSWDPTERTWTLLDVGGLGRPTPNPESEMVFDDSRGVLINYSGPYGNTDTFEWNGVDWNQNLSQANPGPRYHHTMVYDAGRRKVLLFGGGRDSSNMAPPDTWTWDGATWEQILTEGPSSRGEPAMAYDPQRQVVVLFGGSAPGPVYFNDTWELTRVAQPVCQFYDDFSGNLSQWDIWNGGGSYTIQITGSQGLPAPSLLIDDYLNWGAAVFSKQTFTYLNGLEISADQKSDAPWQDQRYTNMGLWRGGPETSLTRTLAGLSVNDNGNTIDCQVVYDECGEEQTEYYRHPFPNTGQWFYGRILIRPDGYVEFYVGPDSGSDPDHSELQHIYTSAHPVTLAYDGQATVKLGNRRNFYDNVCVRIPSPSEGGPVAYWSFDDSGDPGRDDSGNGHHGTVAGATWSNGALWFDGVDDQVTIPSAPDLELAGAITVAAWVHPTGLPPARSFGTHSHVLSKSNSNYYGGGRNYELDYTRDPSVSGRGWFNASGGTVGGVYTELSYPTGAWYHVLGVYDPVLQENRIYFDGELSATRSTVGQVPIVPNNAPVVIGYGEVAAHFFHFEGAIDEVYIYDRVLLDDEIRSLAVARGTSPMPDCNDNGIPDECEPDSDGDGVIDDCDDATCGNGLVELPEECDDGNIISGDGCSSICTIEPDYTCSGEPSVCQPANQSPVCVGGGPYEAECDGSTTTIQLESRSTDPDPGDTLTHAWSMDCPDGAFDDPSSPTPTLTFTSTAACEQGCNVDLTVTDDDGAAATCSTTVTVHDTNPPNVDCPVVPPTECTSPEGAPVTFDVGRWDLCDSQPQVECVDASGNSIESDWVFPIGSTHVTCTAEDACGLTSLPCSCTVEVNSTPPVITSMNGSPLLLPVGDAVTFVVEFDDNPGDVHSAGWDFGDGQTSAGDTENPLSTAHTYDLPGIYTVSITILDRCGNEATDTLVVVVYDPAAGFTTGGGWFVPDADSFIDGAPVTDTASKANFGFVVKYKKGADNPDGNLEFVYKAGDLNLNSTDMDWLVVQSTTKVRFKGLATINGSQDLYTFKVTAEDKGEPGTNDTFQIEIWTGVVDTENGPPTPKHKAKGVLGGGNIKIHE